MKYALPVFSLLFALSLVVSANAQTASFIADAVQKAPGKEPRTGRLYVSKQGTRFEYSSGGEKVIQIIQPQKGLIRMLFPDKKTYMEARSPVAKGKASQKRVPCRSTPVLDCTKKAQEKRDGIDVEHWLAVEKKTGHKSEFWWDPKRRMMISQLFPDGGKMQARMTGKSQFEGRPVEQWTTTVMPPKGPKQVNYMLYAPDLGLPVMELNAAGFAKEIHNIVLTKPDPTWYALPREYRRVQPPLEPRQ